MTGRWLAAATGVVPVAGALVASGARDLARTSVAEHDGLGKGTANTGSTIAALPPAGRAQWSFAGQPLPEA
jgi:hypothetical protein